jgi:UDP-glucuronate decarboxylase
LTTTSPPSPGTTYKTLLSTLVPFARKSFLLYYLRALIFIKTNMKILITGGAGFIGSHLARRLLKEEHDVLCVDNFFTGQKDNVLDLMDNKKFEILRHDITFPLYVEVDQIYNLACPAAPIHYQFDPVQTTKTSVHGSINILGLAKRTRARVLQASTSEIYGDPEVHPQPESYLGKVNPIGPRACYDEGKRCAETLFFDYHRQYGVDIRVVRIFNTFGPNMHLNDGRVVSNFIIQALRNQDITIFGEGQQTRSFCYVDDLVDGLIKMMNNQELIGPVNLGNDHEITIKELAEIILNLVPETQSQLIFKDLPKDDPKQRRPDLTLAKETLGYQPVVDLQSGILKTIEYFRGVI